MVASIQRYLVDLFEYSKVNMEGVEGYLSGYALIRDQPRQPFKSIVFPAE